MPNRFDLMETSSSTDADRNALATPVEVAKMLRVQPTWVYAHQQELPGLLRLGRYVRFRRAEIEEFVKGK
jgi:predicted DNA-binding transcriptional regulator AlpA